MSATAHQRRRRAFVEKESFESANQQNIETTIQDDMDTPDMDPKTEEAIAKGLNPALYLMSDDELKVLGRQYGYSVDKRKGHDRIVAELDATIKVHDSSIDNDSVE